MKIKAKKSKIINVITRIVIAISLCAVIAVVPTIYIVARFPITDKFGAKKAEYQGVLEIWHIDTFEGGTLGKYQYLKARAIEFENSNKGLYFMVKNMTETQCLLALENGQTPAMFSFGVGVGEQILSYLDNIDKSNINIRQDFMQAGCNDDNFLAAAWCRGVYSLITTQQRLDYANQSTNDLASIATNCGYTKTLKNKKTKTTYSLAFGSAGYVCPQMAFAHEYKKLVQTETSIDLSNIDKTSYSAYCDFIEGKASILLGTQRDLARIENRKSVGKIDGVIYQHLTNYTDLVQYLGISKTQNPQIYNACNSFIQYITGKEAQQKLGSIGMFSVIDNANLYSSGEWYNIEIQAQNPCLVENAFTKKQVLSANKQSCIDCKHV